MAFLSLCFPACEMDIGIPNLLCLSGAREPRLSPLFLCSGTTGCHSPLVGPRWTPWCPSIR